MNIAIVDYQLGNLFSVKQACQSLGYQAEIVSDPDSLRKSDALILPGVGAFAAAMTNLNQSGMKEALLEFAASGKSFLGICLGMQLLFTESEEFDQMKGLNLLEGQIKRIPSDGRKVPQVGWNQIHAAGQPWQGSCLKEVREGEFMYFVHSYYCAPKEPSVVLCTTEYDGFSYCSAVRKDNVVATQFHPEKSAEPGLTIYANWLKSV
jgi:glutamine amidotransferase